MTEAGGAAAFGAGRIVDLGELSPAADGPPARHALAGLGARGAAALIDAAVVLLLVFVESYLLVAVFGVHVSRDMGAGDLPYFMIASAIAWLYGAGFESGTRGATPGKRVMKLEVVDLMGERPGFARASLRFAVRAATFPVGWIAIPLTSRRQALHDLAAGTLVVRAGGAR